MKIKIINQKKRRIPQSSYESRYRLYEQLKAQLAAMDLTPAEYEVRIQELTKKLRI